MLRIAKWHEWQAAPLTKIRGKRRENNVAENAPYAMPKVFVASALDGRFVEFAESVGSNAEAYFLRTLQYAALHDPFGGTVNVRREAFGPIVLTRAWDVVSKSKGCAVFDAFMATGIGTREPRGEPQTSTLGAPHREPLGAPDGDASSNSGSGAGSGSGSKLPPNPPTGGREEFASLLSTKQQEPLSSSDRYAFEAIYKAARERWNPGTTYVVQACDLRKTLLTPTPDADGIRAYVTNMTPMFMDQVKDARVIASMEVKGRKPARGGR